MSKHYRDKKPKKYTILIYNQTNTTKRLPKDNTTSVIVRLPPTKFWVTQIEKCKQHKCEQEIHRLRTNPDTRRNHPAECRSNPEGRIQLHPETKIRILKDLEKKIKGIERPPTITPTRFNRT